MSSSVWLCCKLSRGLHLLLWQSQSVYRQQMKRECSVPGMWEAFSNFSRFWLVYSLIFMSRSFLSLSVNATVMTFDGEGRVGFFLLYIQYNILQQRITYDTNYELLCHIISTIPGGARCHDYPLAFNIEI